MIVIYQGKTTACINKLVMNMGVKIISGKASKVTCKCCKRQQSWGFGEAEHHNENF